MSQYKWDWLWFLKTRKNDKNASKILIWFNFNDLNQSNRIIEKELADTDYALYRKKVAKNDIKQAKIELHKNLKLKALNKKYNNNLKDLSNIDIVIEELDDKNCCFPK